MKTRFFRGLLLPATPRCALAMLRSEAALLHRAKLQRPSAANVGLSPWRPEMCLPRASSTPRPAAAVLARGESAAEPRAGHDAPPLAPDPMLPPALEPTGSQHWTGGAGGAGGSGRVVRGAQAVQELPYRRCLAPAAHGRKCQVFNLGGCRHVATIGAATSSSYIAAPRRRAFDRGLPETDASLSCGARPNVPAEGSRLGGAPHPSAAPRRLKLVIRVIRLVIHCKKMG